MFSMGGMACMSGRFSRLRGRYVDYVWHLIACIVGFTDTNRV
jgi:hypothetical protein